MSALHHRLRGVAAAEVSQLYLLLSIVILALLLRFLSPAPALLVEALFSCVSMPATYALAYYHAKAYMAGRFVARKEPEPVRMWVYETVALLTSFAMGYTVFAALSGSTDLAVFAPAFIAVQAMRMLIIHITGHLKAMGVDVQHPAVVLLVSLGVAATALAGLSILLRLSVSL